MLELIFSAIGLGIMLSLIFIGPIFFILIETSFSRGARHALVLDFGVIFADIVCIVAAYYASGDLVKLIDEYPEFYRITALIVLIYGVFMICSKAKMNISNGSKMVSKSYLTTFINGFFFNILNIGVMLFWLVTVISVRNQYPDLQNFIMYISIVIITYLAIDLLKIFLAKKCHTKFNQKFANTIRKAVGVILVIFSVAIFLQSFKEFNHFDKKLEEAERQEIKYKTNTN